MQKQGIRIILILLLTYSSLLQGQVWDHNANWPIATEPALSSNPNGVWSYGYLESGNIAAFHLYDRFIPDPYYVNGNHNPWANEPALNNWSRSGPWDGPDNYGNNGINTSSSSVYHDEWPGDMYWAPNQTNMMTPGGSVDLYNQPCTRFTAPFAGQFQVYATFINSMYAGNRISGFGYASNLAGSDTPDPDSIYEYSTVLSLEEGETIDFTISRVDESVSLNYNGAFHHVGFNAIISQTAACMSGLYLKGDLNHDCYVNLEDFALLTKDWLKCSDPLNPGCTPLP